LNDYLDKIPLVTPREVVEEIRTDLITGEILKNLNGKA
jgi:hypothetical protein